MRNRHPTGAATAVAAAKPPPVNGQARLGPLAPSNSSSLLPPCCPSPRPPCSSCLRPAPPARPAAHTLPPRPPPPRPPAADCQGCRCSRGDRGARDRGSVRQSLARCATQCARQESTTAHTMKENSPNCRPPTHKHAGTQSPPLHPARLAPHLLVPLPPADAAPSRSPLRTWSGSRKEMATRMKPPAAPPPAGRQAKRATGKQQTSGQLRSSAGA